MQRLALSVLLTILLLISFSQEGHRDPYHLLMQEYERADEQYQRLQEQSPDPGLSEREEERRNLENLQDFTRLIPALEKGGNDSLAFHSLIRAGRLAHYFDSLETAMDYYLRSIRLFSKVPGLADSFLFKPYLFAGRIYYQHDQFDSALIFFRKADQINDAAGGRLRESNRLYNLLGVLLYETGNYRQSENYFEKALALLSATNTSDRYLLVNYNINIASILVNLEEYEAAKKRYEQLLTYGLYSNEIWHNLGIIHLRLHDPQQAIAYFRKVNYGDSKQNIDLNYYKGIAFADMHQRDSADRYLQLALAENTRWNGSRRSVSHGLILKYSADVLFQQRKFKEAAEQYQQAVMQFTPDFSNDDPAVNPDSFTGVFSYINLFNTLLSKAACFDSLYAGKADIRSLNSCLDTYRAAFALADFVERTYDSDEARLFLNKIKYTAHNKPIDVCIRLYELTKKRKYLESAFQFDQQNKASILSLNVQENALRNSQGNASSLLSMEANLRSSITRYALKATQVNDSSQLKAINANVRDLEIQLGKVQDAINNDPAFQQKVSAVRIPQVQTLQERLDNTTALLSYHLSGKDMLILVLTKNNLHYYRTALPEGFIRQVDAFKNALHRNDGKERYAGAQVADTLYKTLIYPLNHDIMPLERLIIIPDDELNYLPFEALQDENGKYLIEKFSVQYQYSAALLGADLSGSKAMPVAAFAPFTENGFQDPQGDSFSALPASKEEISGLQGNILTGRKALKQTFLSQANHYGIIHLATHASVDNKTPLRSYIAFSPTVPDYKLYASEIYDMNLDSTQLIILSACETGDGRLVKGEGLMSLSRAFAYAGCPNIITSLWKAEDKTTAFLTQRLHHYLEKGLTKDKALQKAKLDLLKDPGTDPRFKTPNYWAHLLFIGNYETDYHRSNWWWIGLFITIATAGYIYIKTRSRRSD